MFDVLMTVGRDCGKRAHFSCVRLYCLALVAVRRRKRESRIWRADVYEKEVCT